MDELWRWLKWQLNRLFPACPACPYGRIHYAGEDWTGRVWLSIYRCDKCGKEYV